MSLKKQAVSGLFWTFGQQFSVQIINFFVQLVLARLLLPSDFGLIAMLSVFMAIGITLTDSGLTSSLIRSEEVDEHDYSTVFFVNLLGSILIYFAIFVSAPFIASFYDQPILTDIVRVYTITFVIKAFSQVQMTRLTKEMNFKLQMSIQIPSVVIAGACGLYMAYSGMGVWALVWLNIIQSLILTSQLWIRSKWIPSLSFDSVKLRHHFNFGYKLTISGLLNTIFNNAYNLVIGKFFSATELGFYNRADSLRMFPVQNLSTALNKVTYPMFSKLQNDDIKLKKAYKKLMIQVLFWLIPLMIILIIIAEPLFKLVLTEKWLPAVPYFQLLCVSGILYPLQSYNLNILNVKGRSDLFLRLEIIKKIVVCIGIISVIPYGIYGLLVFQVSNSFLSFYINSYYSGKMINYSMLQQLRDVYPMFVIAILIGLLIHLLLRWSEDHFYLSDLGTIVATLFSYMSLYLVFCSMFKSSALIDFKNLIIKR